MTMIEQLNQILFLAMNADTTTPSKLIKIAIFLANDLMFVIPLVFVALWFWGNRPIRNSIVMSCFIVLLGLAFNVVIGLFWQHPRPFMIPLGHTFIKHVADSSFPSDHMTVMTAISFGFLFLGQRLIGVLFVIASLLVAWARIFLGVHFPEDMIGSVIVCLMAALIVTPLWKRWGARFMQPLESIYRNLFCVFIRKSWVRA